MKAADMIIAISEGKSIPYHDMVKDTLYDWKSSRLNPQILSKYRKALSFFKKKPNENYLISLSEEELQTAKKYLGVNPDPQDLTEYAKLLPLTKFANSFYSEVQKSAIEAAAKLIALFGSTEKALAYLKKYQESYPNSQYLVNDATQFEFPEEKWDKTFWRELAEKHMPSTVFARILPYAGKIEKYVKQHDEEIRDEIKQAAEENHRNSLAEEYKKLTQMEDVAKMMAHPKTKNTLIKMRDSALEIWAREHFGFPKSGQLNAEQKKQIKEFRVDKSYQDKSFEFEKKVSEDHRNKLLASHQKKKITQDKESFIAERIVKDAKIIAANVATACEKIFSVNTDLSTLSGYGEKVCYSQRDKDPKLAKLFFENGISEKGFNTYLTLIPQDNPKSIPDIFIDGKEFKHDKFYIKKISSFDPHCAVMGKLTGCCQFIGGPGNRYVEHSIQSEHAGIYVLCKKTENAEPSDNDLVIAQAWGWRGQTDRIVLDSIETHPNFKNKFQQVIFDSFTALAHTLVTQYEVPEVTVGVASSGATPDMFKCILTNKPEIPVDYEEYDYHDQRDSKQQAVLANKIFSLFTPTLIKKGSNEYYALLGIYTIESEGVHKQQLIQKLGLDLQIFKDEERPPNFKEALEKNNIETVQALIEKKTDVNQVLHDSYSNKTPLEIAIENNNLEMVKLLVKYGASTVVNTSRLMFAAERGQTALVKFIFEKFPDSDKNHLLKLAINTENFSEVKELVEAGVDVNSISALEDAVKTNNQEIFNYLVSKGATVRNWTFQSAGYTKSLFDLAIENNNLDMVKKLIDLGGYYQNISMIPAIHNGNLSMIEFFANLKVIFSQAQIDEAVIYNHTPMFNLMVKNRYKENLSDSLNHAVDNGNLEIMESIINLSELSPTELAKALYKAVEKNDLPIIRLLVEKKADPNLETGNYPAFHQAAHRGNLEVVQFLFEKKADINKKSGWSGTPLDQALEYGGHADVARFLIEQKGQVEEKERVSKNYLGDAIDHGNKEVITLLFEMKVDINAEMGRYDKEIPLGRACENGNIDLVLFLINLRANVNSDNSEGINPIQIASKKQNLELIKVLVENHADMDLSHYPNKQSPLELAAFPKHIHKPTSSAVYDYLLENTKGDPVSKKQITYTFFKNLKDRQKAEEKELNVLLPQFLQLVAASKVTEAEAMIKENPKLLQMKGVVKDGAGREFEPLRAFQYATWALDWRMCEMLKTQIDALFGTWHRFEGYDETGVVYKIPASSINGNESKKSLEESANEIIVKETYYDLAPFFESLQIYHDNLNTWSPEKLSDHWRQIVASTKQLPACIVQEYCQPNQLLNPTLDSVMSLINMKNVLLEKFPYFDYQSKTKLKHT